MTAEFGNEILLYVRQLQQESMSTPGEGRLRQRKRKEEEGSA